MRKARLVDSGTERVIQKIEGTTQHCEYRVGKVVFRVYFTEEGVSVQLESSTKAKNFEYQMDLSPHGSHSLGNQSVDITYRRTDR